MKLFIYSLQLILVLTFIPIYGNCNIGRDNIVVYALVEQKPTFNGNDIETFPSWIKQHIGSSTEYKGVLQFMIDKSGYVTNVSILKSENPELDNEIINIAYSSPKWEPGRSGNSNVITSCIVNLNF